MDMTPDKVSALYALLGGTAFRLFITHVIDMLTSWQDHRFELERMKVQNELEDNQANRHIRIVQAQKDLGISVVHSQSEYEPQAAELENFRIAADQISKPTGFRVIDFLNSSIRPALAVFCIGVWGAYLYHRGWVLNSWDLELIGGTLGIFIGSRIHSTGK